MRVLVACEFSGIVRDAFAREGADAWSCDLEPSETPGNHYQADVFEVIARGWDAVIAFPPCTHLTVSGAWKWWDTPEQDAAIGFVRRIWDAPVPRVSIENPVGALSSKWRTPDQIIEPWQFGHPETKRTCLWLRGLPPLMVSLIEPVREGKIIQMGPSPDRQRNRSRTYRGIADAMASQWIVRPSR